jgi:hypothetical protein
LIDVRQLGWQRRRRKPLSPHTTPQVRKSALRVADALRGQLEHAFMDFRTTVITR